MFRARLHVSAPDECKESTDARLVAGPSAVEVCAGGNAGKRCAPANGKGDDVRRRGAGEVASRLCGFKQASNCRLAKTRSSAGLFPSSGDTGQPTDRSSPGDLVLAPKITRLPQGAGLRVVSSQFADYTWDAGGRQERRERASGRWVMIGLPGCLCVCPSACVVVSFVVDWKFVFLFGPALTAPDLPSTPFSPHPSPTPTCRRLSQRCRLTGKRPSALRPKKILGTIHASARKQAVPIPIPPTLTRVNPPVTCFLQTMPHLAATT